MCHCISIAILFCASTLWYCRSVAWLNVATAAPLHQGFLHQHCDAPRTNTVQLGCIKGFYASTFQALVRTTTTHRARNWCAQINLIIFIEEFMFKNLHWFWLIWMKLSFLFWFPWSLSWVLSDEPRIRSDTAQIKQWLRWPLAMDDDDEKHCAPLYPPKYFA